FVREGHSVPQAYMRPWSERFGPAPYTRVERSQCFTFSVIRNPFDLLVSMYRFGFPYWSPKSYAGTGIVNWPFRSFRDYVTKLCAWDDYPWICPEQRTSLFFQLHDEDGGCFADLILRQESIGEGLRALGHILGHDWTPPAERVNTTNFHGYADFYDRALVDLVAHRFSNDLQLFGYDFASHDGRVAIDGQECHRQETTRTIAADDMELPNLSGRLADIDFHRNYDALLRSLSAKQIVRHLGDRLMARVFRRSLTSD
ncbi:MAG: sulfotransferase family protein, partial [Alphaproteobacteria bacterium]|nr:sulfotransferase family protein [Alphaproteobacteria bacterium]